MGRIILLRCRACDGEISLPPSDAVSATCPHCQKEMPIRPDKSLIYNGIVRTCISCGHDTLYIQKDFNRNLGLAIVGVGVLASIVFFSQNEPFYAMLSLIITAAVDLVIYSLVDEVTVCYACHAVYRGFARNPDHEAFDLKNLEKYGGRDPRF